MGTMRRIDLHCYPGTEEWVKSQGPYVDALKGEQAVAEAVTAVEVHHVLGFHFHPIIGHFSVDDPDLRPLFEAIDGMGVPVMIDVGTTGMGAGLPGGLGARLSHAHPMAIDNLAAQFPGLTIIASHPGWPWVEDMTAVALHKANVYWELSGWAPKYFPPGVRKEWDELGYDEAVMSLVFHENAERVLGL